MLSKILSSKYLIIFLLTFVNGLSMTMLFPVLPFVIKLYNQPEVVLGILFATFSFFQFIAAPILGALSDKYGRKPVLILTQAGTFFSWIVLGIAALVPDLTVFGYILLPVLVIFLSRVFDGITGGNASVAQAVLADLTPTHKRAEVFGKNGAVFGLSMMVGPALGSLSMTGNDSYIGVAVLGACISALTLFIMIFFFRESLHKDKCSQYIKISFKQLNLLSQLRKWGKIDAIRSVILIKVFMFTAFVAYTSISALYLIDFFGFSADKVGYYLTFTGSFIIFHQAVSIKYFLKKFGDRGSLSIALAFLTLGYFCMGLSGSIYIFTIFYFIMVLGIALSFTTMGSILSRSIEGNQQGEVMGMSTSIESFISIGIPILATYMYGILKFSPYLVIAIFPLIAFCISLMHCPKMKLKSKREH